MANSETSTTEGAKTVLDFLKRNVPKSDLANIESELHKDFVLAKRRSKEQKRKTKKNKTRALSRKEKKSLGFYGVPRDSMKYNDVLALNEIWSDYMHGLLELDKTTPEIPSKAWEQFTHTVYKADFHGSMLNVVRSKCPSYVGKTGICIMDTRNVFKIISKNNIITTIPKKECVFEICVKNIKLAIFGKLLCARPADRSTKKVRCHLFPDLL
ncbi:ribonuclease P protein subunit p29 [Epargyreus clarus]|uniref:ribonuclease P protein subunit p29 n=1 Tax=Epargyreus clarus TaxID=520877 RepID=UPI003C305A7B